MRRLWLWLYTGIGGDIRILNDSGLVSGYLLSILGNCLNFAYDYPEAQTSSDPVQDSLAKIS